MKTTLYTLALIMCFGLTCQYRLDNPQPSQEITLNEMNIALEHEIIYTITELIETQGMLGFVIRDSLKDDCNELDQEYTIEKVVEIVIPTGYRFFTFNEKVYFLDKAGNWHDTGIERTDLI